MRVMLISLLGCWFNLYVVAQDCGLNFKTYIVYSIPTPEVLESGPVDMTDCEGDTLFMTLIEGKSEAYEKINRSIFQFITYDLGEEDDTLVYENLSGMDSFYCLPYAAVNTIEWCSENLLSTKIEFLMLDRFGTTYYDSLNFNLHTGNKLTVDSLVQESQRAPLEEYVRSYCARHQIDNVKYDQSLYPDNRYWGLYFPHEQAWIRYEIGIDWSQFLLTKEGIVISQKIFDMNPIDFSRQYQDSPVINDTIRVGEIFMPVVVPYDSIIQFIPIVKE